MSKEAGAKIMQVLGGFCLNTGTHLYLFVIYFLDNKAAETTYIYIYIYMPVLGPVPGTWNFRNFSSSPLPSTLLLFVYSETAVDILLIISSTSYFLQMGYSRKGQ